MENRLRNAVQDRSKERLRRDLRKRLLAIVEKQRIEKNHKTCQNLISTPEFKNASTVMMYLPLPREVDVSEVILYAWQLGKRVVFPKISWEQRHMIPVEINSLEAEFTTEISGLRNPVTGVPIPFEEIDLVVTPGLGFDKKGNRLGRGGSYYDNFFKNEKLRALKCGLAFEEQVLDFVPTTEHDEPMDFLVTDGGVIYFRKQQGG